MQDLTQLLNYCATHPDAVIRYQRSDMVLHVESDALYLSETKARSRFAGYHYLSLYPTDPTRAPDPDAPQPKLNGPISIPAKILREIVSSAAEAESAGLFYNGKEAIPERTTLEELGHPQPPTPMVTDNSTAAGIANDSVKQRRSKAMDMRYYWIRDRVRQGQFRVYWRRGTTNRADYYTKHHPAKHHQAVRSDALYEPGPKPNYYAALSLENDDIASPLPSSLKTPIRGEGVLITRARQPGRLARRTSNPATMASHRPRRAT
jgi:hypothetical protein